MFQASPNSIVQSMNKPSHSKTVRWKSKLKKVPGLIPLVRLCRILVSPSYRSEWLLKRSRPNNLFQPYRQTKPDRHPAIFAFVRERLSTNAIPRLMSFGCSTGEEAFTLRRYFPQAEIVGVDINPPQHRHLPQEAGSKR